MFATRTYSRHVVSLALAAPVPWRQWAAEAWEAARHLVSSPPHVVSRERRWQGTSGAPPTLPPHAPPRSPPPHPSPPATPCSCSCRRRRPELRPPAPAPPHPQPWLPSQVGRTAGAAPRTLPPLQPPPPASAARPPAGPPPKQQTSPTHLLPLLLLLLPPPLLRGAQSPHSGMQRCRAWPPHWGPPSVSPY